MKERITFFCMMMLFIVLPSISLTSCSKDDENDPEQPIVGTWYCETTHYAGTDHEYKSYAECTYKKDGTVTGYWKDTYKNGKTEIETDKSTYMVTKDVLKIWWDSEAEENAIEGPWSCTFTINGNKMITSEAGSTTWTRK